MRAAYLVSTRIPPQHLVVGLRVEGHFDKGWFLGKIVSVQTLKKSKRIRVHYDDGEEQIYDSQALINAGDMKDLRFVSVAAPRGAAAHRC